MMFVILEFTSPTSIHGREARCGILVVTLSQRLKQWSFLKMKKHYQELSYLHPICVLVFLSASTPAYY